MRLGIFVVMAGRQAGGPETYEHSLVRGLAEIDSQTEYHVFCLDRAAADSFRLRADNVHFHPLWPAWRPLAVAATLPLQLARRRLDLLHATFTPPPYSPTPYLFTHHCFSTFNHPEFYDPKILLRLNALIVRGLRQARLIVCVSRNVLELTAERFGIPEERMCVIHQGVGSHFRPLPAADVAGRLAANYDLAGPYFLYAGKLEARKNVVRIIEAFAAFRRATGDRVRLVLAGRRTPTSQGIDAAIARHQLADAVVELGYVANEDLPALYGGAEAFLFPSLWEGFGIPVIEAMACGTPVVTSNLASLPEVAGDAALLIDPGSTDELVNAMLGLHRDAQLRDSLRQRGFRQAGRFSWEATARQTHAAYQRLLAG